MPGASVPTVLVFVLAGLPIGYAPLTSSPTLRSESPSTASPMTVFPTTNSPQIKSPTPIPSSSPTPEPTDSPETVAPSCSPSSKSAAPVTASPIETPTNSPTNSPGSSSPTTNPSEFNDPSNSPSLNPTIIPTASPTQSPSELDTPTNCPSLTPVPITYPVSRGPTTNPAVSPTVAPSSSYGPSLNPVTRSPFSSEPSPAPTMLLTSDPTSSSPSSNPTRVPSLTPTVAPSPCPPSFYIHQGSCVACPQRFYCPDGNVSIPCPPNSTTVPASGANSLSACQCLAGFHGDPQASKPCTRCTLGEFCPLGTTEPNLCPAGYNCPAPSNQTACSPGDFCPPGTADAIPPRCPRGFFCPTPALNVSCPPGSTCMEGSTLYVPCPLGFKCPTSTLRYPCGNGTYSDSVGSLVCSTCPRDSYCTAKEVLPCPSNSFTAPGAAKVTQCMCGSGYTGILRQACDQCVSTTTNKLDFTTFVVGAGVALFFLIMLYFCLTGDWAKKAFQTVLRDSAVITLGIVGNWANLASDLATFVNIVLPNEDLNARLAYVVMVLLVLGGIVTVIATVFACKILWRMRFQETETELIKMQNLVRFTERHGREVCHQIYRRFYNFHAVDPLTTDLPNHPLWRPVFRVLFRPHSMYTRANDVRSPHSFPSRQLDSLVRAIRENERQRHITYISGCLMLLQAIPMFVITVGPIMAQAPLEDLRGWVFKTSLIIGAMSIGAKAHQLLNFSDMAKMDLRFRKQLYYLTLSVRFKAYQEKLDRNSLETSKMAIGKFDQLSSLGTAMRYKQESRWKILCRALFGECWCWKTPLDMQNRQFSAYSFMSRESKKDSTSKSLGCEKAENQKEIGWKEGGSKEEEDRKDAQPSSDDNLEGFSRVTIVPFRRGRSRYNEEFSSTGDVGEYVEASNLPPVEANVCRRCGAITEKKMVSPSYSSKLFFPCAEARKATMHQASTKRDEAKVVPTSLEQREN